MPVPPLQHLAGEEPKYTRAVFEAILAGMGGGDEWSSKYVLSEDGARVKEVYLVESLAWHPWCEVMVPGSPDPLDEPWLRFPFTARQLAAFMSDGWGYFIQDKYGEWHDGPDEEALLSISPLGGKAKEALKAAYAAYRYAVELSPPLDQGLEGKACDLEQRYKTFREESMEAEGLREVAISSAEYAARRARVDAAVGPLSQAMKEARQTADRAYATWRRAVVQRLLLSVNQVSEDSIRSLESAKQRQQRRIADLRKLGGDWVKVHGKWEAKDRQSGAFGKLVAQEKSNGTRNSSAKSVRLDLSAAAAAEADMKRTGGILKGLAP